MLIEPRPSPSLIKMRQTVSVHQRLGKSVPQKLRDMIEAEENRLRKTDMWCLVAQNLGAPEHV